MTLPLILASASRFRQEQLTRLKIPFQSRASDCDETPLANELAQDLALRLAHNKALAVASHFQAALIIGSDQVAVCDNQILGKPLSCEKARQMLHFMSGKEMIFFTALVLLNSQSGRIQQHVDQTRVQMRSLSGAQIERYLQREPDAVHCAGAAKSEGLGMSLIQQIDSTDPNALIGLPMFKLVDFLLAEGVQI